MRKSICVVPFIAMLTLAACVASAPEAETESAQAITAAQVSPLTEVPFSLLQRAPIIIPRGASLPVHPASLTCENHFGTCRIGQCEEPREEVQNLSVVCCQDGSCTVQNFRVCGCS